MKTWRRRDHGISGLRYLWTLKPGNVSPGNVLWNQGTGESDKREVRVQRHQRNMKSVEIAPGEREIMASMDKGPGDKGTLGTGGLGQGTRKSILEDKQTCRNGSKA